MKQPGWKHPKFNGKLPPWMDPKYRIPPATEPERWAMLAEISAEAKWWGEQGVFCPRRNTCLRCAKLADEMELVTPGWTPSDAEAHTHPFCPSCFRLEVARVESRLRKRAAEGATIPGMAPGDQDFARAAEDRVLGAGDDSERGQELARRQNGQKPALAPVPQPKKPATWFADDDRWGDR